MRLRIASVLVAAALVAPAVADAHAVLVESEPGDGTSLAGAPRSLELRFSEPVVASRSTVQLLDAHGVPLPRTRIAAGRDPRTLVLAVPALGNGAYQVDWDVLARDDGHRSGGAVTFGVGVRAAPAGGRAAGNAGSPGEAVLRWVEFALLAVLVGGIAVSRLLPAGAAEPRRRLLAAAAVCGALAVVAGLVLLLLRGEAVATRWGAMWAAHLAAATALAALAHATLLRPRREAYLVAAGLCAVLVLARAWAGHAAAIGATAVAADAVHLLAALVWTGGLVALALLPRSIVRAILRRFAWTAGACLLALAVTGLYAAGAQVTTVDGLLGTFYGRTLLTKAGLVTLMLGFGVANAVAFRGRLLAAEALVGLEVLVAAALLTASVPARGPEFAAPRTVATPPLVAHAGDVLVTAAVRPNRPGANVVSVLAVSSRRPPLAAIDAVRLQVGTARPIPLRAVGPDRWAGGADLARAGDARMRVIVHRAGRRLATAVAWEVAPPDRARPVVVSSRPLAPVLNRIAALLLIAAALAAAVRAAGRATIRGRVVRGVACAAGLAAVLTAVPDPASAATRDVIVVLRHRADLPTGPSASRSARLAAVRQALERTADGDQRAIRALLVRRRAQGLVTLVRPYWIFNGLRVVADETVVDELAALPSVASVAANETVPAPQAGEAASATEPNIALVNAPAVWELGHTGQGVVVASLDTGVDATHPDLAARWRGGANSWFDPNGEHPTTPIDVSGHGTQTMGVMVGGTVGVAPDARWIAAKIFNDHGVATTAGIHAAFQWLLDPDGNSATADAPNVVNNSWTLATGCNLAFEPDLEALRAGGILPVFAAGNAGPLAGTNRSPADNPGAFAVGATDLADVIAPSSSRGPSACDGATYPQLTAPGVSIRTTDLYGGYVNATGTSVAAPHVAGGLALLLGAFPGATADRQAAALEDGAIDLGTGGPDDDYGWGRLDLGRAYDRLASAPDFTLAVAPASATTPAGGSVSYSVDVVAVNGFAGDVALSVTAPASAQGTFSPAVVAGGSGSSMLTVATTTTLVPGTYPLTIRATGGALTHTRTVSLVVPAPPDFSLGVSPSSRTTTAGTSVSFTITASSQGGFAGDVALSLSGLTGSQAAWSFTPGTIGGASGTSQLVVTPSAGLAPGSYPLTITGTSGGLSHTAAVTLVVTAAPDFTLAVTPASRTIRAGSTTTFSVTIGRVGGFSSGVTMSVAGLGSGAVGSFAPNPAPASASTLTVRTSVLAARGTFTLRITGRNGALSHQVTATLTVTS